MAPLMNRPPVGHIIVSVQLTPPPVEDAGTGANVSARAEEYGKWVQCLDINKTHVLGFSKKPYKWIRFITGAIVGAEGILCTSENHNASEIDYDEPLLSGHSYLYYRTTPADLDRIFPLDPDLANDRIATGSDRSSRCNQFRENIVIRDGECVASGLSPEGCDAVHLIAHVKGDAYISALTDARSRAFNEDRAIINDIDSVRNGLLVNKVLHPFLASSDVAFLVTPNFAMSTSDVDPDSGPDVLQWTVHDFYSVLHPDFQVPARSAVVPHNRPLRVPTSLGDWPPRIIFDVVYASVVYNNYKHQDFADFVNTHWRGRFYPAGEINTHCGDGGMKINHEKETNKAKTAEDTLKRDERHAMRQNGEDMDGIFDMFLAAPQMVVRAPPTKEQLEKWKKRQEELKATEEELRAAQRKNLHDNVTTWLGAQP